MKERLSLQFLPGGFCLWGPTLLASDLLLGRAKSSSRTTDHQLLRALSHAAREAHASRIVLLGSLFGPGAEPDGDLPGLLVPWRSELLETEIAWVYPKAAVQWDQILDFLEISRIASGAKLGEVQLVSSRKLSQGSQTASFIGGLKPAMKLANGRLAPAWSGLEEALVFPSCSRSTAKSAMDFDWDWQEEALPLSMPEPITESEQESVLHLAEAIG